MNNEPFPEAQRAEILAMDRRASPPAPAVAVKLLEWKQLEDGRYSSGVRPGYFTAEHYTLIVQMTGEYRIDVGRFTFLRRFFTDLDAAKAAAQADYEQRIRSALVEPAPAVAVPEGWRELVQEAIDLLAERKYGNPARSPGHNARLMLQDAIAAAPEPPASPPPADVGFQAGVQQWMLSCFGREVSADKTERNHRFLEEALELVQALGCPPSEAHQLVDYVYGRQVGDAAQEVGGVMVTLAALCLANGLDMAAAGDTELARVWTKIDKIRAKQAAKPKHSPLPEAPPAQEETLVDRCFICDIALVEGDIVLDDIEAGTGHRACFGDDREAYCNLATGEPLAPDEPIPDGYVYQSEPAKEVKAEPVGARPIDEWHEDDGDAVWWSMDPSTGDWRGEPAFIGSPLGSDWPAYHTHWTPHPAFPPKLVIRALAAQTDAP